MSEDSADREMVRFWHDKGECRIESPIRRVSAGPDYRLMVKPNGTFRWLTLPWTYVFDHANGLRCHFSDKPKRR
jgi:hypothetical protein